jgi:hypothetical protein
MAPKSAASFIDALTPTKLKNLANKAQGLDEDDARAAITKHVKANWKAEIDAHMGPKPTNVADVVNAFMDKNCDFAPAKVGKVSKVTTPAKASKARKEPEEAESDEEPATPKAPKAPVKKPAKAKAYAVLVAFLDGKSSTLDKRIDEGEDKLAVFIKGQTKAAQAQQILSDIGATFSGTHPKCCAEIARLIILQKK